MMSALILKAEQPPKPKGWGWTIGGVVVGLAFGRFSAASFGVGAYVFGVVLFGLAGSRLALIFDRFNQFFAWLQASYARLLQVLIRKRKFVLAGLAGGIVLRRLWKTRAIRAKIPV